MVPPTSSPGKMGNLSGTTPGNMPMAASTPQNRRFPPGVPDTGVFILAGFKHLPGMDLDAMRKVMLKRISEKEMFALCVKGYLAPGLILLRPYTDLRVVCRYEDEWRNQVMGMLHFGVLTPEWHPLN